MGTADQALRHRWIVGMQQCQQQGTGTGSAGMVGNGLMVNPNSSAVAQEAQRALANGTAGTPGATAATTATATATAAASTNGNGNGNNDLQKTASSGSSPTSTCASSCSTSPAHSGGTSPNSSVFTPYLVENGLLEYARNASALKRAVLVAVARTLDQVWISELRNVFLALDRSRSGTLSVGDFEAGLYAYQRQYGGDLPMSELLRVFPMLDFHNHGCVEYSQFLASLIEGYFRRRNPELLEALVRDVAFRFSRRHPERLIGVNELRQNLGGETFEGVNVVKLLECVNSEKSYITEDELFTHVLG